MTPNQKSVVVTLDNELSIELYHFLQLQNEPQNKTLKRLLKLGLEVDSGDYTNKQNAQLVAAIQSQSRTINILSKTIENMNLSIADLQDAITNQISDEDLLVGFIKPNKT